MKKIEKARKRAKEIEILQQNSEEKYRWQIEIEQIREDEIIAVWQRVQEQKEWEAILREKKRKRLIFLNTSMAEEEWIKQEQDMKEIERE